MSTRASCQGLLALVAACCLAAGAANAQDEKKSKFDPSDFEGYTECWYGDFKQVFDFAPFEAKRGQMITAAELAELTALWKREQARGAKATEALKNDPVYAYRGEVREDMKGDPFFTRIEYSEHIDGRFAFYIQANPGLPFYEKRLIGDYLPQLQKLEGAFEKLLATPLKLPRHEQRPGYAVAILSSRGAYVDFQEGHQIDGHSMRAHYDPTRRLAVTYEQLYADQQQTRDERQAILHEFVHALQHAYYSGPDLMPKPQWFAEGLAEYLAESQTATGKAVAAEQAAVLLTMFEQGAGAIFANGLRDLVTADGPGYGQVVQAALRRAPGTVPDSEFADAALGAFYAQSTLLTQFLYDGKAGQYRGGYLRYVRAVMTGATGWQPFADAFGDGFDAGRMEAEFIAFLRQRGRELRPRIDLAHDARLPESKAGATGAGAPSAVIAIDRTFSPEELALDPTEWSSQLGLALREARHGRLDEALARLTTTEADDADGKARIERERARLDSLIAARNSLLGKNRFVALDHDGKTIRGRVVEVENGIVTLTKGSATIEIPMAALSAGTLDRELDKKRNQGLRIPGLVRAYLLVLGGEDEKAVDKHLTRAGAEVKALQRDLDGYPALQTLGEAAALIDGLARAPVPADRDGAAATFETIRELLKRHAGTAVVQARNDELRRYATLLAEKTFDPTDPTCLGLKGDARLRDNEITLTYDFSDEAQLRDFVENNGYAPMLRGNSEQPAQLQQQGTKMRLAGTACYRHSMPFSAPFTVRLSLALAPVIQGNSMRWGGLFALGVCGDDAGNFVAASSMGPLSILDQATGIAADHQPTAAPEIRFQHAYDYELIHDGRTITWKLGGETLVSTDEIGNRKSGSLFLSVDTSAGAVLITKLSIAGVVDDAALTPIKNRWVAAKVADF